MNSTVTPVLYRNIELRVPLHWTYLASLENLIDTRPKGLKYCQSLVILLQQSPLKRNQLDNYCDCQMCENFGSGHSGEPFRFSSASERDTNSLNTLARLVLSALAPQSLRLFRYVPPVRVQWGMGSR